MKILYHHRTLADGAEGVHIAEMVEAFRDQGHEVHVLGLAASGNVTARRGWFSRVRDMLPRGGFECLAVAGNVLEYFHVRRAIAAHRPDFLYKRHARNDIAALDAARRAGIPTVLEVNCLFTAEGYREFEPMSLERMATALERRAMRTATVRLAVSSPLARRIEEHAGVTATVMPNGANPARFDPTAADSAAIRQRLGLGSTLVIGWCGVIRNWHGLELLLDALVAIPSVTLLIVGDGPARAELEARAAALGVADRVVITGRILHTDMPDYVAAMDVAVVAHDRTGVASPMKLLEYMAMARPVVAPRLENITDVVSDGHEALLFEPGNVHELTRALQRLVDDAQLRSTVGRAGRAAVESSRNWRANAAKVVELVERHR